MCIDTTTEQLTSLANYRVAGSHDQLTLKQQILMLKTSIGIELQNQITLITSL